MAVVARPAPSVRQRSQVRARREPPKPHPPRRPLVRRFDALLLVALATVVIWPPISVRDAAWAPGLEPLPWLAIGGLAAGYVLARTRLWGILAHLLGVVLGLEVVAWTYASSAPAGTSGAGAAWLVERVAIWARTVFGGGASSDGLLFALAMATLAWLLGYVSAWLVFRGAAPWLAIVSNAVAVLMNLSYAPPGQEDSVAKLVVASLALLVAYNLAERHELWRAAGLSVEGKVALNAVLGAAIAAVAILLVAWAVPPGEANPSVSLGWERITAPWKSLEDGFDRLFASLSGADSSQRGLSFSHTLAPRASFDLGKEPVLEVQEPRPQYLRATTSDRYTDQAISSSATRPVQADANQQVPDNSDVPDQRDNMTVTVRVLASKSSVAFAPEEPLKVDQPTQWDLRNSPQDIASIRLASPLQHGQTYTLVAAVSAATAQDLRAAGEDYPDWVKNLYLQLPAGLPKRVADKAHEVVGSALSPYDKALAIETYLRSSFTYSTHVPPVPPDRDWVDYLLFDSQQGYCDYFATAMVVMLRTQGVPARVASGFAPGDLDPATGMYVEREDHAHTWVEAYFPRYGWITFEPSAIRPLPYRPESAPAQTPSAQNPSQGPSDASSQDDSGDTRERSSAPAAAPSGLPGWIAGVLWALWLLAIAGLAIAIAWRHGIDNLPPYQRPFARLVRLAGWAGVVRVGRASTPYEAAAALATALPAEAAFVATLADAYVEGTYAGRLPAASPEVTWRQERRHLVRSLVRWHLRRWIGGRSGVTRAGSTTP